MANHPSHLRHLLREMIVARPQRPKEWEKPDDPKKYAQMLHEAGFISLDNLKDTPLDVSQNNAILSDLAVLEKYLIPVFWNFNEKAGHYQAKYLHYQRIFLVAALITTLISVVNSFVLAVNADFTRNLPGVLASIGIRVDEGASLARGLNVMLGVLTAVISARASYYTLISNYGQPRQRWSKYRRLTEELRITYFKFLAHLDQFSGSQRVYNLRSEVLKLRQQEQENG